jgi:GDSL-like Lipase/Acylhydrolase family
MRYARLVSWCAGWMLALGAMSPALAAPQPLVAWGDSLTAGSGGTPWPTQFQTLSGVQTFTYGYGGESSTQIRNRMLADTAHVGDFAVIWVGRNNYDQTDIIVADIAAMVGHLTGGDFLILGVTNGDYGGYEIPGGEGYAYITQLNTRLASIYGPRFIDVRADLVARYDPTLPQDVIDFNNDTVPTSLRADTGHLNTRGYGVVAESVYARYGQVTAVPEAATMAYWLGGLALMVAVAARRRSTPAR